MRRSKVFFCTFTIALVAALLAGGLLMADVNTRRITFEDSTPPYAATPYHVPSVPLPVGGEAIRLLYQGEKIVLRFLLENFLNIT